LRDPLEVCYYILFAIKIIRDRAFYERSENLAGYPPSFPDLIRLLKTYGINIGRKLAWKYLKILEAHELIIIEQNPTSLKRRKQRRGRKARYYISLTRSGEAFLEFFTELGH